MKNMAIEAGSAEEALERMNTALRQEPGSGSADVPRAEQDGTLYLQIRDVRR